MEHNDPGMDNLDKILGVLNEVEYKLKEMKGRILPQALSGNVMRFLLSL